ncbi:MAG: type II toxin-antitoxin system HicA family toxin [Armatimonadota bacterium]|nr:type II toxin-antitoxin system HicA family toxin [Armatimonadota bacterium]
MSKLRLVPYRQLRKLVEQLGFQWVRCVGSHNTFRNKDGRIIVIPDHGSQVIFRPLLRKILRDVGLSIDDYNKMLDES